MITAEQLAEIIKNEEGQKVVFKRQLSDTALSDAAILASFEDILGNKPERYWLIRESRQDGMVSISFKTGKVVDHRRFAFIEGTWKLIPGKMLNESQLQHETLYQNNIADKCEQLINQCLSLGFDKKKLVFPNPHQQSNWIGYNHYVVSAESDKRFADPLECLRTVSLTLDKAIMDVNSLEIANNSALIKIQRHLSREELKDLFGEWLTTNKLDEDLLCPITLELFEVPYVLDSGRVYEKSSLFDEYNIIKYQKCPFTSKLIVSHPYRLEGYDSLFNECLDKFVILVNKCKKQHLLDMSKEGDLSLILNPSDVHASLFYNPDSKPQLLDETTNSCDLMSRFT